MVNYLYTCPNHGEVTIRKTMSEASETHICPHCGDTMLRVWTATPAIWKTGGNFGTGDNKKNG